MLGLALAIGHPLFMPVPADLETRAAAGNAEALLECGRKLMTDARSFEAFARGADMIGQAADLGHAEAACMLATMEAVGAGRPRNWNRALDHLAAAAEQGSQHARAQLRLLSGEESQNWRELRGGIDIEARVRPPAPTALSEKPRIRVFRGFAQPEECRWMIDRLGTKLGPAVVWDGASGESRIDPYRSNSAVELLLPDTDVVISLLRARIAAATRLPEFIFEMPQIMRYAIGEEFRPHHDFLDPQQPGFVLDHARRGQRIGTFLVYLNEDFEGGETEFPKAGVSFRGRTGDALFFANVTREGKPDPLTLHAGRPPTSGEKWILSQWIRERPPSAEMAAQPVS